ncbi:MAG: DUF72 domain-containing protein [Thermodesulfobacteriota bacterium]
MTALIRVGTSGWSYPHWRETVYPADCPPARWLEWYAGQLDTVELNASFYRLPQPATFAGWRRRTPAAFLWAVKASRYLTHVRRLADPAEPLARLYQAVDELGEKLGPILCQLPPSLVFAEQLLVDFCQALDGRRRHALEVRHPSWLGALARKIMADHNLALCIADAAGRYPYHEELTADFVYLRLHGAESLYGSLYREEQLAAWAGKLAAWGRPGYVYFDNDAQGHAFANARRLAELVAGPLTDPGGSP